MAFKDFAVHYNPAVDTPDSIGRKILYAVLVRNGTKANKSPVVFLSGGSGSGKSLTAVKMQMILAEAIGFPFMESFEAMNVFTPLQYPEKMKALMNDSELKKVCILCLHEAREAIRAKDWQKFLSMAIADANAMSREVKPLIFLILSQFIRDITTDIRYTINYYMKVSRTAGKPARLSISVVWKDDRDLERPKLRRRRLQGYLIYPDGTHKRYIPKYFEIRIPPKEVVDMFRQMDGDAKRTLISKKLNKLIAELKSEVGDDGAKLEAILHYYTEDMERLTTVGKQGRRGWKLNKEFLLRHEMTDMEAAKFETMLNDRLARQGNMEVKEDGDI